MELCFYFTFALRGYDNLSAQFFCYPLSIVCFIGALSLHNLVKAQKRQVASYVTAIRRLSFNPNSRTKLKHLNFLLNLGKLKQLSNIVIWHDIFNNSLTPHPSNGNSPLSTFQLIEHLGQHRERIAALIYCQRIGTTCYEFELRRTGVLVINVKRHLLSKIRRVAFSQEIRHLDPSVALELARFLTIRANSTDLCKLVSRRGKRCQS